MPSRATELADASAVEADRTCVWTLTVDGDVEHTTARSVTWPTAGQRREGPRPWREYWPAEGRASVDRTVALAASGRVARFRMLGAAEGEARTYWATVVAPVRSSNGAVIALVATSSDVTAEVERESLLNSVVQLLPSPVAVKDVETGGYVFWNRAAEAAFGVSADEVLGTTALTPLGPELAAAFADAETEAARSGEHQARAVAFEREGAPRAFDLRTLATFDDFGARHLISLCNDVTERHAAAAAARSAAEAAEAASEAKSQFLANMSHELRTPMNGIVAGADMLARQPLDAHAAELVGLIQGSSVALERLLSGVLDQAAIEAGGLTLSPAPFRLAELAQRVVGLARLAADERGLGMTLDMSPEADRCLLGDAGRLGQVLTNLLANAVKFTEAGHVRLAVSIDDARVRFVVTDTGIGFDEGAKARIFDRFQQGDASITRRFGGSGLGLAISRELVELMGGTLDCESTPGQGSRFWFDLDLPPASEPAPSAEAASDVAPADGLRILVADDHPTNRRVVELILQDFAQVVSVADGREALSALGDDTFDLVLMDMQMPVMDGLSAVREIRARECAASGGRTPIIMLSANVAPEHVAASYDAGADHHLGKPVTAAKLLTALSEVLA